MQDLAKAKKNRELHNCQKQQIKMSIIEKYFIY